VNIVLSIYVCYSVTNVVRLKIVSCFTNSMMPGRSVLE